MAVVAVDPPRLEGAIHETVLAGPANVVHDLVVPALADSQVHPAADLRKGLIPCDPLPLTGAASALAAHRMKDPFRVVHLIDRGRALGTVAAPRARVGRVALEAPDITGVLVHVCQEAASRLAVETGGGNQTKTILLALRPRLGVVFLPVVPQLGRREIGELAAGEKTRNALFGAHGEPLMTEARSVRP